MGDRARFCGSCGAEIAAKTPAFQVEQLAPGAVLKDRYKLVRALPPRGPMRKEGSLLWEALDTTTGGRLQIQLLPRAITDHSVHVAELKRICDLWQKIDHPALVRLERLEMDPLPFLVIEHVDAISFEELLAARRGREHGPFTPEELSTLLPPVGEALDRLAEKGLVHGAVEPGHLLVPDARFGPAARVTLPGVGALARDALGRAADPQAPGYTAPEQTPGKAERRMDVFGLGLTIAHLLSGKHPMAGGEQNLSDIPAVLFPALERSLSRTPEQRPAAAGILVRDLVDAARKLKDSGQNGDHTVRISPTAEAGLARPAGVDGAGKGAAPAALRAAPAPAPEAVPEVEKTIRFVPGMTDESLANSAGGAAPQPAAPVPRPPPPLPPPPAKKAAPPPPPPAAVPEVEKTIRFVPGMTDQSLTAPARPAPPPPPPPPLPVKKAAVPPPPPPAPAGDVEKTIRFVPGMNDSSLAPAPAPEAKPGATSTHGSSAHGGQKSPTSAPGAAPAGGKAPEPEGGGALLEWGLILTLCAIALWQIIKALG